MAISTGAAVEFFGTQTEVSGTATNGIATGDFSAVNATTGTIAWTNIDDAIQASATIVFDFTTAPTANTSINLYARLLNTSGSDDNPVPVATFQQVYVGSFPMPNDNAPHAVTIDIGLPNGYTSQVYEFYIENQTGQTLPSGWTMWITPKAIGPQV